MLIHEGDGKMEEGMEDGSNKEREDWEGRLRGREGGREGGRFSFQYQHIVIEDINITLINRLLKPCVGVTQWNYSPSLETCGNGEQFWCYMNEAVHQFRIYRYMNTIKNKAPWPTYPQRRISRAIALYFRLIRLITLWLDLLCLARG